MFGFAFFFNEGAAGFGPQVLAFDSIVVQHVGQSDDGDHDFHDVRKDVFFKFRPPARGSLSLSGHQL